MLVIQKNRTEEVNGALDALRVSPVLLVHTNCSEEDGDM